MRWMLSLPPTYTDSASLQMPPAHAEPGGTSLRAQPEHLSRFRLSTRPLPELQPTLSDHAFLYVATGNDTAEYAENYGADAVTLHYLLGARSLIFARSPEDALQLERRSDRAIERLNDLNATAYQLPLLRHYDQHDFVIWSGERLPSPDGLARAVEATWRLAELRGRDPEEFMRTLASAQFNQFTLIQLQHIRGIIEQRVPDSTKMGDSDRLDRIAESALTINDKASYWRQIQHAVDHVPRHVPTVVLNAVELYGLLGTENPILTLRARLGVDEGALVVKSALEAGGECCVILRGEGDTMQLAQLMADLRGKGRNLNDTPCLIQRCIEPPQSELPARIGILGAVGGGSSVEASTQVYSDPDRRCYLGSYWSEDTAQRSMNSIGTDKFHNLLALFEETGYRGPIGFDAMLDSDQGYTLIYDANPRLTSAAAVLMVRDAIRAMGIPVSSAVSLGHHGNWSFDCAPAVLSKLAEGNHVFTATSQKGVFLVPNSRDEDRFDVYCINMNRDEIIGAFNTMARYCTDGPAGIYF
jgi:hypothetical protein